MDTPTNETNNVNIILDSIRKNIKSFHDDSSVSIDIDSSLRGDWTEEIENEILKMAKACKTEASNLFKRGSIMSKYGKGLKVFSLIFNALSVCVTSSAIPSSIKEPIVIVFSACSAITTAISMTYKHQENGSILKEVSHGLETLSTSLRCEVYKPVKSRRDVNELIYEAQLEREQFLMKADKAE